MLEDNLYNKAEKKVDEKLVFIIIYLVMWLLFQYCL